jgi:hypothetical protein
MEFSSIFFISTFSVNRLVQSPMGLRIRTARLIPRYSRNGVTLGLYAPALDLAAMRFSVQVYTSWVLYLCTILVIWNSSGLYHLLRMLGRHTLKAYHPEGDIDHMDSISESVDMILFLINVGVLP